MKILKGTLVGERRSWRKRLNLIENVKRGGHKRTEEKGKAWDRSSLRQLW